MKTALKTGAIHFLTRTKFYCRTFACAIIGTLALSACSNDASEQTDPDPELTDPKMPSGNNPIGPLACKKKPSQVIYGDYRFEVKYNTKDQVTELTTYIQKIAPKSDPGIKTLYTITYNELGKVSKVSKVLADKPDGSYLLEYNTKGELSKQSEFDGAGKLLNYSQTQYGEDGLLNKMTTYTEGNDLEVSNTYEYSNGNLIKKTTANLYDKDSKEYYKADYTFAYEDTQLKVEPFFDGPLGLRIIANLAGSVSPHFQSTDYYFIFFHISESSVNKNMLKNVQIIAHRYNTRDTTKIDYNYQYDAEGFPIFEKGALENVTRRTYTSSFGVPATVTTPHKNSFNYTIDYNCN